MNSNTVLANRLLTYAFVIFLLCIGLDKIVQTNLITSWQTLVGPVVQFLLPFHLGTVVMIEGAIEILLGVLLLTRWQGISIAVLVVTIGLVAIDLFILRYYNLAIRELLLIAMCVAMKHEK